MFAVLFAWILLGELPRPIQLLGGLFILAGVIAVRSEQSRTLPVESQVGPQDGPEDGSNDGPNAWRSGQRVNRAERSLKRWSATLR